MPPLESVDPSGVGAAAAVAGLVAAADRIINYLQGRDKKAADAQRAAGLLAQVTSLAAQVEACNRAHDGHTLEQVRSEADRKQLRSEIQRLERETATILQRVERAESSVQGSLDPLRETVTRLQITLARLGAE